MAGEGEKLTGQDIWACLNLWGHRETVKRSITNKARRKGRERALWTPRNTVVKHPYLRLTPFFRPPTCLTNLPNMSGLLAKVISDSPLFLLDMT